MRTLLFRTWRRFLWLIAALSSLSTAMAFTLSPISMDFDPSGRGANRSFKLENESDSPVAVQVSILTREMDLDGKETQNPAEDDFAVYPTQVVLAPKQIQTVRVNWTGTAKPERELAYRILAEQLPVNLTTNAAQGARINLVVRYLGTVYIVPKGVKANVILESVTPEKIESGSMLALVFHNQGSAHALLQDLQIDLKSGDVRVHLGPADLKGILNENVLAGHKRRFLLPCPKELEGKPVQGVFQISLDR